MARQTRSRRRARGWSWLATLLVGSVLVLFRLFGAAEDVQRAAPNAKPVREAPVPPAAEPEPEPSAGKPSSAARNALSPRSPWSSPEACEAALRARAGKPITHPPRIASWNLEWFPDGTPKNPRPEHARDVAWVACIVAFMQVDVLAVQEVVLHPRGRAAVLDLSNALDRNTHGHWQSEFDECADDGRQHVGFLYDATRVNLQTSRMVRELNPGRSACDRRLRPGYAAHFSFRDGARVVFVNVHLDSGTAERDFRNRGTSLERLQAILPALRHGRRDPAIVLGDFNTMGCERCAPRVSAEEELRMLDQTIGAFTPALARLPPDQPCTEYYRGRGTLLDHVLVAGLDHKTRPRVLVQGLCAELACGHISRGARLPAHQHLSDHCPVVLELVQEP